MKNPEAYSSHLPWLMKAVRETEGPVVELGVGWFSTPVLHWLCARQKRWLLSYDTNPAYVESMQGFRESWHGVELVNDWDDADLERVWGVALVDHKPGRRRKDDIRRLANCAQVIVVHDTEDAQDGKYRYSDVWPLFRWRVDSTDTPRTTVVSNFVDVSAWT